jgi:glycosyltransferase involved in cell wall biosynthesis
MALKICRIATVPFQLHTNLREQVMYVADENINLTLVSSPGLRMADIGYSPNCVYHPIAMSRKLSLLKDPFSLIQLISLFRKKRFHMVHSSTPKAGWLTALAGCLARVPIRIHTYTGQSWSEKRRLLRHLLRGFDWLIGHLNTHCYCVSSGHRDFFIKEKIVKAWKISVLGPGSLSGVDLKRFDPERYDDDRKMAIRSDLGLSSASKVILFVGRVNKDKGIVELVAAFKELQTELKDVALILVGPFEREVDPLPNAIMDEISSNVGIYPTGFVSAPEDYMAIADVLCLPSYREGLPVSVIQAAAMEVPAVLTNILGSRDTIEDGRTGILVTPKSVADLKRALEKILMSPELKRKMGAAARQRAVRLFDSREINRLVVNEYRRLAAGSRLGKSARILPLIRPAFPFVSKGISCDSVRKPRHVLIMPRRKSSRDHLGQSEGDPDRLLAE